jgi:hypothetical protein
MLYDGRATDALDKRPDCNICGEPAVVDGKMVGGSWGYMCEIHFILSGRGLGAGVGQILLCGDERDALLKQNLEQATS